ncbi:MAG: hypothetical protein F4Z18_12240 [Caldilineaceae bacterium SB0666_bin_21]|nr:hypothetical protein [Caldilineaceae bacterium SB0666_bin_21]
MSKLDRFRKLGRRTGSSTRQPEPAEEKTVSVDSQTSEHGSGDLPTDELEANTIERPMAGTDEIRDTVGSFSRKAASTVAEATAAAAERVQDASSKVVSATDSLSQGARRRTEDAAAAAQRLGDGTTRTWEATASVASQLMAGTQTLLASNLSMDLNDLLQAMVKGSATIYDKAMDANYLDPLLRSDLGGSYHRLFDGGHTLGGAFRAARDASPDDTLMQETLGAVQGLLRDGTTLRGLPLANWDKGTFDSMAGSLDSTFGIPKSWFYDLNTYDAAELLGGTVGAVALIFGWNRADTETFAKLVGSMGLSAAMSANPLLLVVTVVALARSVHKARQTGEYAEFVDGQLKGGFSAGATLSAVALVGIAGGPAGLALLVGITTAILVNLATNKLSLVAMSRVVAKHAVAAAKEARAMAKQQACGLVDSLAVGT